MSSISATALGQIIEKDKAERREEAADDQTEYSDPGI